jgi:hypothetical protein
MIQVKMRASKMAAPELLQRANAVYAGMNLNPAYPNPPIPMQDFRETIDDLSAAITATLDGGMKATAEKNRLADELRRMLRELAHYVQSTCNGDMPTLLSSGFPAVTGTRRPPTQLSRWIRNILPGPSTGSVLVALRGIPGAASYQIRWSVATSDGTPETWSVLPTAGVRKPALISGLTPGTTYIFQTRAVLRSGLTEWSDPITRICT